MVFPSFIASKNPHTSPFYLSGLSSCSTVLLEPPKILAGVIHSVGGRPFSQEASPHLQLPLLTSHLISLNYFPNFTAPILPILDI